MPGKDTCSPDEEAELKRLYEELGEAHAQAIAAITASSTDGVASWMEVERKIAAIVQRIKEIQGTAGEA
jgi:hypothetical protein